MHRYSTSSGVQGAPLTRKARQGDVSEDYIAAIEGLCILKKDLELEVRELRARLAFYETSALTENDLDSRDPCPAKELDVCRLSIDSDELHRLKDENKRLLSELQEQRKQAQHAERATQAEQAVQTEQVEQAPRAEQVARAEALPEPPAALIPRVETVEVAVESVYVEEPNDALVALETELAETKKKLAKSSALAKSLTDQNNSLTTRLSLLRKQTEDWLMNRPLRRVSGNKNFE